MEPVWAVVCGNGIERWGLVRGGRSGPVCKATEGTGIKVHPSSLGSEGLTHWRGLGRRWLGAPGLSLATSTPVSPVRRPAEIGGTVSFNWH